MRVLLVNKYYYERGGDCIAVLTTEQLLKAEGHEVAIFSMRYKENLPSPWEHYFPSEISFSSAGIANKLLAAQRLFHSPEVSRQFNRLLDDFRPDVVHLHNIHSYLSPIVAQLAHKRGIRVVWTLHDYKLLCPTYSCLREEQPCELCFHDKSNVFRHRCMKNSRAGSLLAWMEAIYWSEHRITPLVDLFISPSAFLREKMIEGGFPEEKITVLHNFMYKELPHQHQKGDHCCYVGRLSEEKGVKTLLEAAKTSHYPLRIIGGGPLLEQYKREYTQENIQFLGYLPQEQLLPIVQSARFLVIPSVWYENNPFSVIESLCMGTPVLGARIGGIPELIRNREEGMLFSPGNIGELREKIHEAYATYDDDFDFGKVADHSKERFSPQTFYHQLMNKYHTG